MVARTVRRSNQRGRQLSREHKLDPCLLAEQVPARAELATAVRLSLRTLEQVAPGRSVEVRVPPFAVGQCVPGPRHTRGTPPNVIETDPRTWLLLVTGRLLWTDAVRHAEVDASGSRADLSEWLPLLSFKVPSEGD